MARQRDPRRDEAFEIWKSTNGEKPLKDIAAELNCSPSQIRKWKSQDNWEGNSNVTNEKRSVTKKGTGKKERVRSGNPNPKNQFSHRNNPKLKHGLLSKYLHAEQIEIMELVSEMNFADQLWYQIQIKFSAIIRMQKIMWVEDADSHLAEPISTSADGDMYKVAFGYEQYESYIKAQARAMAEYRNLVKQFNEMAHEEDERRLKLEQMTLGIDKTKLEIERMGGEGESDLVDDWVAAMGGLDE